MCYAFTLIVDKSSFNAISLILGKDKTIATFKSHCYLIALSRIMVIRYISKPKKLRTKFLPNLRIGQVLRCL